MTITGGAGVLGGDATITAGAGSTTDGNVNIGTSDTIDVIIGQAGEITDNGELNSNVAITDGDAIYVVDSAGTARYALADASADATNRIVGFAGNAAGGAGTAIRRVGIPGQIVAVSSNLSTIGAKVYVSETGGAVTETAPVTSGAFVTEIGVTITTGAGTSSILYLGVVSLNQNP